MIRGYAEQPSPRPGDSWVLRVSTDAARWRAAVYRCGSALVRVGDVPWQPGVLAPDHLPSQDWGQAGTGLRGEPLAPWAAYPMRVPEDWSSGVYVLVLDEEGGQPPATLETPDARAGTVLLVVRAPADTPSARILYKLPVHTYQAYNLAGGRPWDSGDGTGSWCLYNTPPLAALPEHVRPGVSLHRPGGGTGGHPYDIFNSDPHDPTPRQTFVHWDWPFIRWLEDEGYAVDYCTDADLHRDGLALLTPYAMLLCVGHDEYWSRAMRGAAEAYVQRGGNIAFLCGNTCWWHIEVTAEATAFARTQEWWETGDPENRLTGVSFRNGGERDRDEHPDPIGFRVQHADHWVFSGTGLRDGDVLGAAEQIVGYECDGAVFSREDLAARRPVRPTGEDGSPRDLVILGVGDTRAAGWGMGNGAATMAVREGSGGAGTVFTAATTDWCRVVVSGRDQAVEQVTRNVLDRLSRGA